MPANWVDAAKQYYLWEGQRAGNIELMLQRTDTNSRTNEHMARWIVAVNGISQNWPGKYKNLFGEIFVSLQEQYLNLEAYGRKQAIELAAAIAKANIMLGPGTEIPEKRGGLAGLFGR